MFINNISSFKENNVYPYHKGIVERKNNPKDFLDKKFIDYSEFEQFSLRHIFQHSLKNAWFFENNQMYKFSEMDFKTINEKTGVDSYQDVLFVKDKKTFLKIKGCCGDECETCNSFEISNEFLLFKKKAYDENPCSIIIQESRYLKEKNIDKCLEVCAKETIEKNSFLGIYSGEFDAEENLDFEENNYYSRFLSVGSKHYSVGYVNAFNSGNWTRLMNWGFPNVASFPCCDGFENVCCMAIDKIEVGQKLVWHYGSEMIDQLFTSRFVLLNKEQMEKYFSEGYQKRYEEFLREYSITKGDDDKLAITGKYVKLSFVIEVPAAYLYLHARGLLNIVKVFESQDHPVQAFKEGEDPFAFRLAELTKNFFKIFEKTLDQSNLRGLVYKFIIDNVEEIPVVHLLHILQQMHLLIQNNQLNMNNFNVGAEKLLKALSEYKWEKDDNHPLSEKIFSRNYNKK